MTPNSRSCKVVAMTARERLISAALVASDMFREGDTPDDPEIRELVRAVDNYRDTVSNNSDDHQDDCLMCAVRALTDGDPDVLWTPKGIGDTVSGVVLRHGTMATKFNEVPFVDLWTGGATRIRIVAFPSSLRSVIDHLSAQVGDRLTVRYDGMREVETRSVPRKRMVFSANVQRGH